MFELFDTAPPDSILGLAGAFRKDENSEKINLMVGVFKNEQGRTPVLDCVKAAERRLLESEDTKGYLGIDGAPEYVRAVQELLFTPEHDIVQQRRAATVQTPGGTGALRVAADLMHGKFPTAKIWCSKPTWGNHPKVFAAAGLEVAWYRYLDDTGVGLDFDAMLAGLNQVPAGDIVCLHACCHNPTGVDPSLEQWRRIASVVKERGVLALVDFAYQGFADGIREDAAALAILADALPEFLVCNSFSKNFGLYGERVGGLTIVAPHAAAAQAALSHAKACVRSNYSNPPRHGGAIVTTILQDDALRAQWEQEVAAMRTRIADMRTLIVGTMAELNVGRDFSFIQKQRGMFSYTGLTPLQVDQLRSEWSIYIVGDGRINIAGVTPSNVRRLCKGIAAVL